MGPTTKKFPKFQLLNDEGQSVSSSHLAQGKFIIYFYPKDHTPGCTKESESFAKLYPKFKALGYEVYGVSKDTVGSHEKFKHKLKLPFSLISDPDQILAQALDLIIDKTMYGKKVKGLERSTVIVEDGRIVKLYRGVKASEHPAELLLELKIN